MSNLSIQNSYLALLENVSLPSCLDADFCENFWNSWKGFHFNILTPFDSIASTEIQHWSLHFMKKRERFLETLFSYVDAKKFPTSTRSEINELLRQHDDLLRKVLQHRIQELKAELKTTLNQQKATAGYTQSYLNV